VSRQAQGAAATNATGLYALDEKITFNVLDHVEYDSQNGKIILMGHQDATYATSRIPYLQYLATLLEYPSPQFSLEWTRDSELRVAELRRRLDSDDEWRRLAGEWGRWIDDSERVTPAGRYFMPLFGIEVPPVGQKMDRYQVLSGVFSAIGEQQASEILAAFGGFYRAMPNPGIPQLYRLFRAAGVYDLFVNDRSEMQAGRMTKHQVQVDVYRAMFNNFDQALNYSDRPTSTVFNNALRRGQTPDAAMEAAMGEFDRQFKDVYGDALRKLYRSKPEFQIPITLVNPSLRNTLHVEPKFIGINSSTLLAKLLLDADVAAKKLLNAPELVNKIPGYQTEVTYRLRRPGARRSGHVSTARLWISVEQIDASRSSDGNILALGETKMRINMRGQGQDGRDLPNQRQDDYEALLSSLYDGFARYYSPVFHELRETAKLAYVAQWLKARNTAYKLPSDGLASWRAPATVPGVIFISWSADPTRPDVQTVSAIGGVTLRVPPAGPGVCVKFCDDRIPTDSRIRPVSSLSRGAVTELVSAVTQARTIAGLYLSNFHNPFEAYANAETLSRQEQPPAVASLNRKVKAVSCAGRAGEVSIGSDNYNNILLRYEGENKDKVSWVQIGWTQTFIKSGSNSDYKVVQDFIDSLAGDKIELTVDIQHPRYFIDSIPPGLQTRAPANPTGATVDPRYPFQRAGELRDRPGIEPRDDPVKISKLMAFLRKHGASGMLKKLDHFDSFLVSDGSVCARVSWQATQEIDLSKPGWIRSIPAPSYDCFEPCISNAFPNAEQFGVLNRRYPGQPFIRQTSVPR
jgi:hypothetical protein